MKTLPLALFISLGFICSAANLNARILTLMVGGGKTNDSVNIGTNESVTMLTGKTGGNSGRVTIEKEGLKQDYDLSRFDSANQDYRDTRPLARVVIAGSATVSLVDSSLDPRFPIFSFITLDIQPDLFPPDKTLVVPEGSGANIVLESSTNLVNWTPAPLGLYTNRTGNLFFRLRADRIP